ncbi:MAG: sigma-70 family RNA polymerase sigma factor, partial [Planctomycetota bacterium]
MNSIRPEELLEHRTWIRSLARRLVSDEHGADDIVQDVCLAAIENPPKREAVHGWWRRVVRYRAQTWRARRRHREEREATVARPEAETSDPSRSLERVELQRKLADLVLELDEPYRRALVLRFFESLSVADIARSERVAVSTVRFRLGRAIDRLRHRLDGVYGSRAVWTTLCASLACAEPIVASSATVAVATVALQGLGGLIVTKQLWITLAAIVIVATGLGALVGAHVADRPELESENVSLRRELESLRGEAGEAERALENAQSHAKRATNRQRDLERELERLQAAHERAQKDAAIVAARKELGGDESDTDVDHIDWNRLYNLFAKHGELTTKVAQLLDAGKNPEEHLSPLELTKMQLVFAELHKAGAKAKLISPYPFLDGELRKDYLRVLIGAPLSLTADQLSKLTASTDLAIDGVGPLEDVTPLESYRMRNDVVAALHDALGSTLNDEQGELWSKYAPALDSLMKGSLDQKRLGLKRDQTPGDVTKLWKRHYGLSDSDLASLGDLNAEYVASARDVLQEHEALDQPAKKLSEEKRNAIDAAYFELQLETERRILQKRCLPSERLARLGAEPLKNPA